MSLVAEISVETIVMEVKGPQGPASVLDDDGNFQVQGVILSNSGNVSLGDGVISENSSGAIVKHDGVSDGDDLPYIEYGWRIFKYQEITAGQNQAGVALELGRFTVPASLAVGGQKFLVTGTLTVEHASSSNIPGYLIGFLPAGVTFSPADANAFGYQNNVTTRAAQMFPAFALELELVGSGSTYSLTATGRPVGVLLSAASGGDAVANLSQLCSAGFGNEEGPLGATHDIVLYYGTTATGSAPASKITIDFTIRPVL
jgi:hypothetical protein